MRKLILTALLLAGPAGCTGTPEFAAEQPRGLDKGDSGIAVGLMIPYGGGPQQPSAPIKPPPTGRRE